MIRPKSLFIFFIVSVLPSKFEKRLKNIIKSNILDGQTDGREVVVVDVL